MIKRYLAPYLKRDAGYYPVIALTGPRQSGKTTLARAVFPDYEHVLLEETESRQFAKDDPRGFLTRYPSKVIFDEVQRVPELLSAIQGSVDRDGATGRFILTGSHNLLLMEKISQTLAGRCGILHLLPFSRAELEGGKQAEPGSVEGIFRNRETGLAPWETIYAGFYPRIHDRKIPPGVWLSDYVQTYLQKDVRSLLNVGDLETFERFLMLAAGRAGQILNFSSLANDCGISVDTSRRWISVLKTSFIVFLLTPHHANFNKRVIRSPKLYFHDTGLACQLLRIRDAGQLQGHPLRGALFENYVISEARKAFTHHRKEPPLYFWRDHTGHEVDLLIEESGVLHPVEIKSGATVAGEMLESLKWWRDTAGKAAGTPHLVYGGAESYTREGVSVHPWFAV